MILNKNDFTDLRTFIAIFPDKDLTGIFKMILIKRVMPWLVHDKKILSDSFFSHIFQFLFSYVTSSLLF